MRELRHTILKVAGTWWINRHVPAVDGYIARYFGCDWESRRSPGRSLGRIIPVPYFGDLSVDFPRSYTPEIWRMGDNERMVIFSTIYPFADWALAMGESVGCRICCRRGLRYFSLARLPTHTAEAERSRRIKPAPGTVSLASSILLMVHF